MRPAWKRGRPFGSRARRKTKVQESRLCGDTVKAASGTHPQVERSSLVLEDDLAQETSDGEVLLEGDLGAQSDEASKGVPLDAPEVEGGLEGL